MFVSSAGLVVNLTDMTDRLALAKANIRNISQLIPEASTFLKDLPSGASLLQTLRLYLGQIVLLIVVE